MEPGPAGSVSDWPGDWAAPMMIPAGGMSWRSPGVKTPEVKTSVFFVEQSYSCDFQNKSPILLKVKV